MWSESWKQHICGSCFFIHSATLCLLTGAFSPFTFKVIIDRYVLTAILWLAFGLFLYFYFVLSSFFFLLPCDLMTIFSVNMNSFLFCVCVSVIDFWLMVTMRFIYSNLCTCVIILSWWSLKFKCISTALCFYSPPPHLMFLTSYFISFYFVYFLTTYCGYRWFYYFCLLTFLLAL